MTPPERRTSGQPNRRLRGRGGRRATDRRILPIEIPCELCEEAQAGLCAVNARSEGTFLVYRCPSCGAEIERPDTSAAPPGR